MRPGRRPRGFSLIELMLTVSFVMLGALLVQGSFMRSADMFGRYTNTLRASLWVSEDRAKAQEMFLSGHEAASDDGTFVFPEKSFQWTRAVQTAGANLYSIRHSVQWTESGKPFELVTESYVYKKDVSPNG